MQPQNTVDRKPEIVSPATPITTPISTFNPNATILELILKLRSCFQLRDSEEVAAILQSREDKMKQNITDLKNREDKLNLSNIELKNQLRSLTGKCTCLEASREKFAVEKERFEAELKKYKAEREKFDVEKERIEAEIKKCKAECEEYRDDKLMAKYELEKARLDLNMWREKEVISAERYEKRIAEKEDENERMRVEIVKLREEIVGLVDGKKKAENLAPYWENLYKQVEPNVMKLENDLLMIFASYPVLGKSVEELLRSPPVINPKSVNNGNLELVERKTQSNLSKCDANAHASPCAGYTVDTSGRADAGPNSSVMAAMACGKRMPIENQAVIEIDDSDDEQPIIETASALKTDKDYGRSYNKDPASQSISRGKRPLVCTQKNGDVGDADRSNKYKRKTDSAISNKADENSYISDESISTLAIENLFPKKRKNKPFNFEAEMLTAFNKDDELCLNAVCALHRVQKCDELPRASQYRGFSAIDTIRGSHLAKFLIDGDPQGKLQKSVVELQEYDYRGIGECRKLARNHFKQLFQIYQKEEDPFFNEYLVKNYPK
ncbi:uncharacterized protein LOC141698109 isoform X2 [Apium graveolens]|uniref:uncharacterized protein LOC141698109 isoform X2 n=1 Tax=Apium graveolens TaxID=4045 RepID=UPI003D79DDB4